MVLYGVTVLCLLLVGALLTAYGFVNESSTVMIAGFAVALLAGMLLGMH